MYIDGTKRGRENSKGEIKQEKESRSIANFHILHPGFMGDDSYTNQLKRGSLKAPLRGVRIDTV